MLKLRYMGMCFRPCFKVGAEHGNAVWVGGGVGESKQHWRNYSPQPLQTGWVRYITLATSHSTSNFKPSSVER